MWAPVQPARAKRNHRWSIAVAPPCFCRFCFTCGLGSGTVKHERRLQEIWRSIFNETVDSAGGDAATAISALQDRIGSLGARFFHSDSQFAFPLKFICGCVRPLTVGACVCTPAVALLHLVVCPLLHLMACSLLPLCMVVCRLLHHIVCPLLHLVACSLLPLCMVVCRLPLHFVRALETMAMERKWPTAIVGKYDYAWCSRGILEAAHVPWAVRYDTYHTLVEEAKCV